VRSCRCYFLYAARRILAAEVIEAEDDEGALARAAEMLAGRPHYRGIEIGRRILAQPRDSVDGEQIRRILGEIGGKNDMGSVS
jgi:hypothetical protein